MDKLCDANALKQNYSSVHFMQALTKVARITIGTRKSLPQFSTYDQLSDRIKTLAQSNTANPSKIKFLLIFLLFVVLSSIIFLSHIAHF